MSSEGWFGRVRTLDVRLLAAIAATFLLVIGVMWIVPTTPNSKSFTFDSARRGIADARPIELGQTVEGSLVDGSDSDFYRIDPLQSSYRLDIRMTNGSTKLIPGLRIFDIARNLVQEHAVEYISKPGANIDSSFLAQSRMTYYVQVFGQRNTTGPYSLSVTVRQP
jgi:hypothetical protein